MRQVLLFLSLLDVFTGIAQSHKVELSPEYVSEENEGHGFTFLYELKADTAITRHGSFVITYPPDFKAQDTSFASEYFVGHPGKRDRGIPLLIADRVSGWPIIYLDRNNNLDFSDDGEPVEFSRKDSTAVLRFHRKDNPEASFSVLYIIPSASGVDFTSYDDLFQTKRYVEAGIPMRSAKYSFFTRRLNNKIAYGTVAGDSLKVALHDYNCNGYFNDAGEDRIFVAPPNIAFDAQKTSGSFTLKEDTTLFSFEGQVYEITQVDPLGKSLQFKASDIDFEAPIAPGQEMPDFQFQLIDGTDTSFAGFIGDGKYLIIDVWGAWCKGCHSTAPSLQQLHEKYRDKLTIIGLNTGEPKETINDFVKKYDHHWPQGKLTDEIRKGLLIDAYPTYILVDPKGRILSLRTYPHNIKKILENREL